MKNYVSINTPDKPDNMGRTHLFAGDVLAWAKEEGRAQFLPNPKIEEKGAKLTFDVAQDDEENPTRRGFAMIQVVPDDFENA